MNFLVRGVRGALLLLLLAGCAASTTTATHRSLVDPEVLGVVDVATTSTSTPPPPSTSSLAPVPQSALPPLLNACPATATSSPPQEVREVLNAAASDPRFDGLDVGVSVWVDGWGEVLAVEPDRPLAPASNQKLLVAIATYELLDPEARLRTSIEEVDDSLVLRSGADPTLTIENVDALVNQVVAAEITNSERLVIDVTPYAQASRADGWLDWQIPTYVGPLSGFMIDNNRWTNVPQFVTEPALFNGERLASRLEAAGVTVGDVTVGWSPSGQVVAEHLSPTIDELVNTMMLWSDNQHADLLMLELGRATGGGGTLAAGAAAIDDVLRGLCVDPTGVTDDGSGLSRDNTRSAREFQQILRVLPQEVRSNLLQDLPVGGVSGTLASRFGSDLDRVQAKTGTIIGGRALSGYATTDSGRDVVFSIIVNGEIDAVTSSVGAIDDLITTVLRISA